MNKIHFHKAKELAVKYKSYHLPIIIMMAISIFVSNYKDKKLEGCVDLEEKTAPLRELELNNAKLEFISKHKFNGPYVDFKNFIRDLGQKNYATIKQINEIEEAMLGKVKVKKFAIKGLFWHDSFIFNFIDEIQDFLPGFLKILSVDIDKFSKITTEKPIMKLEILCEVFQKQ